MSYSWTLSFQKVQLGNRLRQRSYINSDIRRTKIRKLIRLWAQQGVYIHAVCGHPMDQGRPLYFCPLVSIFLLSFYLFSSPNLSGRRLDVYYTSTHGVVLVRIWNACLKCGARGSLKIQNAKMTQKSPAAHHRTTLSGCVFATKAYIDNLKNTC